MSIENFEDLLGATLTAVVNNGDEMLFTLDNGKQYKLYHDQDCCEYVRVEDIIGELDDLIGSPLLMAEEVSSLDEPPPSGGYVESYTWTFYKLATIKGYVTIRWLGESNGYYSESVYFAKL